MVDVADLVHTTYRAMRRARLLGVELTAHILERVIGERYARLGPAVECRGVSKHSAS